MPLNQSAFSAEMNDAITKRLGDGVICDRCGATVHTYGRDTCVATLGEQCPGFASVEAAWEELRKDGSEIPRA